MTKSNQTQNMPPYQNWLNTAESFKSSSHATSMILISSILRVGVLEL